jgi:hypothetical protein
VGFLTDQITDMRTHSFSQLPLEGGIDLSEGFG